MISLAALLNRSLKDEEVVELLEAFDCQVKYHFDRLHEGAADSYSVDCRRGGFELRFDESQRLETIWCHLRERQRGQAVDPAIIGVPAHASLEAALDYAAARSLACKHRVGVRDLEGGLIDWVLVREPGIAAHYQFDSAGLQLVTLMLKAPGDD